MRVTKRRLTAMQETAPGDQASSDPSDEDDDFFAKHVNSCHTARGVSDEPIIEDGGSHGTVTRLFIKTNTRLPASAACERMFSAAGYIVTRLRARIGDGNVENQLLKINQDFVR